MGNAKSKKLRAVYVQELGNIKHECNKMRGLIAQYRGQVHEVSDQKAHEDYLDKILKKILTIQSMYIREKDKLKDIRYTFFSGIFVSMFSIYWMGANNLVTVVNDKSNFIKVVSDFQDCVSAAEQCVTRAENPIL
jgi:hypothetical protein